VGGFLGAGKTTLLLAAGRILARRGWRTAIITNDQGDDLVDSQWVASNGVPWAEVGGGCFCCRFSDLRNSLESLLALRPHVVFAEPVGSCTDLAATVLRPMQESWGPSLRIAPLTVVIDPARRAEVDRGDAALDVRFLFRRQEEEADLLLLSKSDRHGWASTDGARRVSARTEEGVLAWLNDVLEGDAPAASRELEIDYARYAAAEAALGWVNWRGRLESSTALLPAQVAGPLLDDLEQRLQGAKIAHLKCAVTSGGHALKASLTAHGEKPDLEGDLQGPAARRMDVLVNLRALGPPEELLRAVRGAMDRLPGRVTILREQAFQPAPPRPERRIARQ
jgi:hypothetical protein